MPDPDLMRIGVDRETSSLTNRADDPTTRRAVLIALQRMQVNVSQVQNAMQTLQQALQGKGTAFGTKAPQSKKDLRDSILSLLMVIGFIEREIGGSGDVDRLAKLASRAVYAASSAKLRP